MLQQEEQRQVCLFETRFARASEARSLWERNLPIPLPRVRWGENLHEASCVILQVRRQLVGWRSLAVFIDCGTIWLRGLKPRKGGDMVRARGPLGTPVIHTRVKTEISYRGASCENNQPLVGATAV
jgi:hypothetical protein